MGPMRATPLLLLAPLAFGAASIAWQADLNDAKQRAADENKILFLALNMDGEAANDRMAEDVYEDKQVVELTAHTVALVGSRFDHGGKCKRFDGIDCADHQQVEKQIRADILQVPPDEPLVAPQHIFCKPDGTILLSVPYEMKARELTWCLVTAIRMLDPEADVDMPDDARAPRRLIRDGALSGGGDTAIRPMTEDEVEETIQAIRAGMRGPERIEAVLRLIATDDENAVAYIDAELGGVQMQRRKPLLKRLIRAMGAVSPPSFAVTLHRFLEYPEEDISLEAAAALEQMASEDSVKPLRDAYREAETAVLRAHLIRALGVAGVDESAALKELTKAWDDADDEPLVAVNALLVLGLHTAERKGWEAVEEAFASDRPDMRQAAALGLAYGRAEGRADALRALAEKEADEDTRAVYAKVLQVLDGEAALSDLAETIAEVTASDLPRPRFFAGQTGAEDAPSEESAEANRE